MAEYAPLFTENGSILPKNTQPLTSSQVKAQLASTTVGAVAGTTTTVNRSRVKASPDNGGKVLVEVDQPINRASTAADVTALKTDATRKNRYTFKKPSFGFVRDRSGNGGGAFTRG